MMARFQPGTINDRLAKDVYEIDEGNPHILGQPGARAPDWGGKAVSQRMPSPRLLRG